MKQKRLIALFCMALLLPAVPKAQSIAVLEFTAGAGITQSDVEGISSIFNTYFSPEGYTSVERTQINQAIKEQRFQVTSYTKDQIARLGQVLGVTYIVVGDVTFAMKEYNVDVRVVNAESGEIVAKDGITWKEGTSYRETLRTLGERLSKRMPPPPVVVEPEPAPEPTIEVSIDTGERPLYRPVENSLRFAVGYPIISVGYCLQKTPNFMFGFGAGYAFAGSQARYVGEDHWWDDGEIGTPAVYGEAELRTPRYAWSLFLNVKIGYLFLASGEKYHGDYVFQYKPIYLSTTAGFSYYDISISAGVSNQHNTFAPLAFQITYNLPIRYLRKVFF